MWKTQRVVLIKKEDKNIYRPLCIIHAWAKLMEYIIKDKIMNELGNIPFVPNQFGYTKNKSTVDAMDRLMELNETTNLKRKFIVLVTMDVKNAFNSIKWSSILKAMEERNMPAYLKRLIRDYFKDSKMKYLTTEGWIERKMQKGVPQGSVIGPILWNMTYDGLIKIKLPDGTYLLVFADDAGIVIITRSIQEMKIKIESAMK